MRILITSGGTKVPIDPVRSIGNMSTGRFGAALASEALLSGLDVIYLISEEGCAPFTLEVNAMTATRGEDEITKVKNLFAFKDKFLKNYSEYRYKNFQDYAEKLKNIIEKHQPDVVISAAAVSDYLVADYSNEKVRSDQDLKIYLEKAPKLINQIKNWLPNTYLVAFKLLVDATDAELVATSLRAMQNNQADIVVANNLASLVQGRHEILIVEKNGEYQKITTQLAKRVIERLLSR